MVAISRRAGDAVTTKPTHRADGWTTRTRPQTKPSVRDQGSTATVDDIIAAILCDRTPSRLSHLDGPDIAHFFERAWYHSVVPLLFEKLVGHPAVPPLLFELLHQESRGRCMWELRHQQMLQQVGQSLRQAGIPAICFKGTALAYDIYAKPHMRTRCDTDLLVAESDLDRCRALLTRLGFVRGIALPGSHLSSEESWRIQSRQGQTHTIDLHWRINSAKPLCDLFTFADLKATALAVPALGDLLVPDRVSSLLIACMHRAVHRGEVQVSATGAVHTGERLFWLYDLHLLSKRMAPHDWDRFVTLAHGKGLATVTHEALQLSRRYFQTNVPPKVLRSLQTSTGGEAPDVYLRATGVRREILNVIATPGLGQKLAFIREVLFPPQSYLLGKYPNARIKLTPVLHLRRWTDGLLKRLHHGRPLP